MRITLSEAWIFAPFVLPICFYVIFNDLRVMKITNRTVLLLGAVFLVVGLFALPFDVYLWRFAQLGIMLLVGMFLFATLGVGAGDAKFIAVAAPFIAQGDAVLVCMILSASILAAFITHRIAKYTPLRRLAPDWVSWDHGKVFPFGTALAGTLGMYLVLGAILGS